MNNKNYVVSSANWAYAMIEQKQNKADTTTTITSKTSLKIFI